MAFVYYSSAFQVVLQTHSSDFWKHRHSLITSDIFIMVSSAYSVTLVCLCLTCCSGTVNLILTWFWLYSDSTWFWTLFDICQVFNWQKQFLLAYLDKEHVSCSFRGWKVLRILPQKSVNTEWSSFDMMRQVCWKPSSTPCVASPVWWRTAASRSRRR